MINQIGSNSVINKRESNVEILRLVSTFFIIFIHSNFMSLGAPVVEDFINDSARTWIRTIFESLGIIGVNCFIFISGWFGINLKIKGLLNLLFQCVYFYIFISFVFYILGFTSFELAHIKRFLLIDDWFVVSYLLLMILSPVLNKFIEYSSKYVFKNVLILYFIFAFTYGTISGWAAFRGGYSTIFFIGYYLLVRYIRLYRPSSVSKSIYFDLCAYLSMCIILCICYRYNIPYLGEFTYLNPIIIISSIYFSMIFTKFTCNNRFINWLAASAFSIYLLHGVPGVVKHFISTFKELYISSTIVGFWLKDLIIIFVIAVIAIVLDQPRKYFFNKVCTLKFFQRILSGDNKYFHD